MADPRVATSGTTETVEDLAGDTATTQPQTVTMDVMMAALNKLNNDLSAKLGRLAKQVPSTDVQDDQPKTSAIDKTLKERLAALEAKEAVAKARAVRMTVKEQLVANGADPVLADMATAAILEAEGERFQVAEGKYGEFSVVYGDGNACADWAKAWMQTESGKRIASGSAAPNLGLKNGKASAPKTVKQVPVGLAHTVSSEDLRSGRVEIVT